MVSNEIIDFIKENKVAQLYKKFEKSFNIIDGWADTFIDGDLLDENQLAFCLDQSTGIYSKLSPVVNALESYMARLEYNKEAEGYKSAEKLNAPAVSLAKAEARAFISDVRDYVGDFRGYFEGAKQNICSAQSRLKRLVVEKGAKKAGYTGEVPIDNNSTGGEAGDVQWGGAS